MRFEFRFPDIGEGIHEGTVLEWRCSPGQEVEEGQTLALIETDKVVAEIPAPRSGRVESLEVGEGETIQVGQPLVTLETAGEEPSPAEVAVEEEKAGVVGRLEGSGGMVLPESFEGREAGLPEGSGNGRSRRIPDRAKASPVARRLASREGVDIETLRGSGPGGRVLKEDVLQAHGGDGGPGAGSHEAAGAGPRAGTASPASPAASQSAGAGRRQALSTFRRTVARNMEASWQIPAAVVHEQTAVDELVAAREALRQEPEGVAGLTYLPFFIKAAAFALGRFPLLNARFYADSQEVETLPEINIGFALDGPEGLVVPVIPQADRATLRGIQEQIDRRRREAREKTLGLSHLRGGTFTISNYGGIGGLYGRPLILPPQVALLGIGRLHQAPVVRSGAVVPGWLLPLSLVFDHRLIDGAYAVRFLRALTELLARPYRLIACLG